MVVMGSRRGGYRSCRPRVASRCRSPRWARMKLHTGNLEQAAETLQRVTALVGENDPRASAWLAHVYALAGQKEKALAIFDELHEASKPRYVSHARWLSYRSD